MNDRIKSAAGHDVALYYVLMAVKRRADHCREMAEHAEAFRLARPGAIIKEHAKAADALLSDCLWLAECNRDALR